MASTLCSGVSSRFEVVATPVNGKFTLASSQLSSSFLPSTTGLRANNQLLSIRRGSAPSANARLGGRQTCAGSHTAAFSSLDTTCSLSNPSFESLNP